MQSQTPAGDAVAGAVEIGNNLANKLAPHDAVWVLVIALAFGAILALVWMLRRPLQSIDRAVNGRNDGEPRLVEMVVGIVEEVADIKRLVSRNGERLDSLEGDRS